MLKRWAFLLLLPFVLACGEMPTAPAPPAARPLTAEQIAAAEAVAIIRAHLHQVDSGLEALRVLPDLEPILTDYSDGDPFPERILPFTYYWSESGQITVAICAINQTLFVCPYRMGRQFGEYDRDHCEAASIYLGTRGMSGNGDGRH